MNKKIIDYTILNTYVNNDDDSNDLADEVCKWIRDGYQPFGAPFNGFVEEDTNQFPIIYQAMVKYEEDTI
jgi:hypothetical protein